MNSSYKKNGLTPQYEEVCTVNYVILYNHTVMFEVLGWTAFFIAVDDP